MSFDVSIKTPNKHEIAEILISIAELIKKSGNKTISLQLDLDFDVEEKND